jgi:photosystem II stability/assembly factor-like uncharacterized protein
MSQQPPDDEFERRLRDVFRDRNLGVPVSSDAIERIHAGARRRQQRRSGAAVLGAVAVIGVAAIGIGAGPHGHGSTVAANKSAPSPSPAVSSSLPASPSVSPSPAASASAVVVPTPVVSPPGTSATAASFQPLSVSAVGPNVYWVLGSAPCAVGQCATLEHTTDGGATFTRIGHNGAGGEMPPVPTTVQDGTTVRDVRFGDTDNGWLYGGAFYTTHDGGSTWIADTALPNDVVDVAAASGHVWAVALSAQNGSESYGLYHATYGTSGTGTWTKVPLGTSIIAQPGLAVVKQNAFLLAQVANGQGETFVIAGDGKSLVSHPAPCASSGNTVSVAGDGALWIRCSGGNTTSVFVSNDQAVHWQAVSAASAAVSVGGVDATHAVIESTDGLHVISTAGDSVAVPYAAGSAQSLPGFIGFTTTKLGFIVTEGTGAQLWRTTDGGSTWSVVGF